MGRSGKLLRFITSEVALMRAVDILNKPNSTFALNILIRRLSP